MCAGVYLHIPFCRSRCSYCDFATDVFRNSAAVERYVSGLRSEIAFVRTARGSGLFDLSVDTIYFGGGTPSLLSPSQTHQILESIHRRFSVERNSEITMEMNPGTVTAETLAGYRSLGVNRASFGVQTFNDRHLKLLARGHNADDARNTFRLLREAGFENISLDLIVGLPGQTIDDWERNLEEALKMEPEHLSLYLLEIHEGTPLAEQIRSGRRPKPDDELAASMYEVLLERIADSGYAQYEISNFAKPGFESRHNTKYWRLDRVYGYGVSAHSFDGYQRYANERDTAEYVRRIEESGRAEVTREPIDAESEYAFLGLRMTDGIDLEDFRKRFGTDLLETHRTDIEALLESGLVENGGRRLRLTRKGMLFSNEVFAAFV